MIRLVLGEPEPRLRGWITYTSAAPAGAPPWVVATGISELHIPRRAVEFSIQTPGHPPRTVLILERDHIEEIREFDPPVPGL